MDRLVVRLLDPAERPELFGADCLRRVATAAYDLSGVQLDDDITATFERVEVGVPAARRVTLRTTWPRPGEGFELAFDAEALSPSVLRADGFWTGQVIVRQSSALAVVESVRFVVPHILGLDAAIAADGPLPVGAALEAARRAKLLAVVRRVTADDAIADAALAALYHAQGVDPEEPNATELLIQAAALGGPSGGAGSVTFAAAPTGQPVPTALPVRCALFLRDQGFALAELLQASAAVKDTLAADRGVRAGMTPFRLLRPVVVVWLIAEAAFDDADWPAPGLANSATPAQQRARRVATLAEFLVPQGIALSTVVAP